MKRLLRLRPSPAMVVACIALGVALGGTSVAAIEALPKNSVGTKQLKKNAVISSKVKNGSLLRADFKSGQIPAGPRGPAGPTGAAGAAGAPGAQGIQGPPGPVHLDYNVSAFIPNPAMTQSSGTVACDPGMHVTGGGVSTTGFFSDFQEVNFSAPDGTTAWEAFVDNRGMGALSFRVYVICTDATSITGSPAGPALAK
jgi:hypothetical protein